MTSMKQFRAVADGYRPGCGSLNNLEILGLCADTPRLRVFWMYPDILSLHGGRGDLMALLRFATVAKLPMEIHRKMNLSETIDLESADLLYFCCGDLACVPDVVKALEPQVAELRAFADSGRMIVANGSSGAILAKELRTLGGPTVPGLGLLDMRFTERSSIHGDDLWLDAIDGVEVIGNEISRANVTLGAGQAPFGTVRYGRGNCGDGFEGAVTKNVISTGCLGPVLVRNPALAMALLRRAAEAAGLDTDPRQFLLKPTDIATETLGILDAQAFISKKMKKPS